jgi:carboxyl-terminal processing protease
VALVSGAWLLNAGAHTGTFTKFEATRLFDQVYAHVTNDYVDEYSDSALYRKAVDGMLYELHDQRSLFLPSARFATLPPVTSDRSGVPSLGLNLDLREGILMAFAPIPGSPAERGGVLPDDRILRVDGKSVVRWTMAEAVRALSGAPGSTVRIDLDRGNGKTTTLTLTRADPRKVPTERVAMLSPDVGYIGIAAFDDSTPADVRSGVQTLLGRGMRSLVLDLRGNSNGSMAQGIALAELFLDRGQTIVSTKGRTASDNASYSDGAPQAWPSLPLAVLVDAQTANASELVAGALQDHDRAALVGRQTYGSGSRQTAIAVPGDGGVVLTTARWYTPSGRAIGKPSVDEEDDDALNEYKLAQNRKFNTDSGRAVYGVGGIRPDVLAGDTVISTVDYSFAQKLGDKTGVFEDELKAYALDLKARHAITSPDGVVTPAMLEELHKRLVSRGVVIDPSAFQQAQPLLSRLLGYEIAREDFGVDAEFRRRSASDAALGKALQLGEGARNQRDLLRRASLEAQSADTSKTK